MNGHDVHPSLRRFADGNHPRLSPGSDFQRLMWTAIFYEKKYSKYEVAECLGVAPDTLHAYCNGDLRLHIDTAAAFVRFVREHDPRDHRFVEYLMGPDYAVIPRVKGRLSPVLRDIVDLVTDMQGKVEGEEK